MKSVLWFLNDDRHVVRGLAVAVMATMLWSGAAFADERHEYDIPGDDPLMDDDRPTLEGEDEPEIDARQFVQRREMEGLQLADEAIRHLRDLIERTPVEDPDRAEYLYNLAENYWADRKSVV